MTTHTSTDDLYRIDRAHGRVYKRSIVKSFAEHGAGYWFAFSFYELGVNKRSRKSTILRAIEEAEQQQPYSEEED